MGPPGTDDAQCTPIHISAEIVHRIRMAAQDQQTTAMTVVLAAYAAAAAEALDQPDILINIVMSERDHPGLKDIVSCMAHSLPVSIPQAAEGTLGDQIKRASMHRTTALQHSIPYLLIRKAAGDMAVSMPFLALNADLDSAFPDPDFHGLQVSRLDSSIIAGPFGVKVLRNMRHLRIVLFMRADGNGGLAGGLAWDRDFVPDAQAHSLHARFLVSEF